MTLKNLTIEAMDVRTIRLPLINPFTISTGTMHAKEFLLVTLKSGGLEGHGECVADPLPDYLEETNVSSLHLLREGLKPSILGKSFAGPAALEQAFGHWRGHRMIKAAVEMAFWDLWARAQGEPLMNLLGGTGDKVAVGVSLGITDVADMVERAVKHHKLGYKRIKLKIMPGRDIDSVEAVRKALPVAHMSVDANSAYGLEDAPHLARLDGYNLDYIEQPLAYDDIHDHAKLAGMIRTPVCLDESIRSVDDARKAVESGAARVINIKVGRVGGHQEARRIHDLCAAHDIPVWCGGMLESGIGRAHNIHLSTLPNFRKPGDTSSASRYFQRDIIVEKLETADGYMPVPKGAGTGVNLDMDYVEEVTIAKEGWRA